MPAPTRHRGVRQRVVENQLAFAITYDSQANFPRHLGFQTISRSLTNVATSLVPLVILKRGYALHFYRMNPTQGSFELDNFCRLRRLRHQEKCANDRTPNRTDKNRFPGDLPFGPLDRSSIKNLIAVSAQEVFYVVFIHYRHH